MTLTHYGPPGGPFSKPIRMQSHLSRYHSPLEIGLLYGNTHIAGVLTDLLLSQTEFMVLDGVIVNPTQGNKQGYSIFPKPLNAQEVPESFTPLFSYEKNISLAHHKRDFRFCDGKGISTAYGIDKQEVESLCQIMTARAVALDPYFTKNNIGVHSFKGCSFNLTLLSQQVP